MARNWTRPLFILKRDFKNKLKSVLSVLAEVREKAFKRNAIFYENNDWSLYEDKTLKIPAAR